MTTITLTFQSPSQTPDADEDVLASVLRDDGTIEVWEAHYEHGAWWSSNSTMIMGQVVSWARKPDGVDLRDQTQALATTERHVPEMNFGDTTDWKAIATELAQRVNYAVTYLDCRNAGLLDLATGKVKPWRHYMVEALEMMPGVVVDREMLDTLSLPPSQRKKAQVDIRARRDAADAKEPSHG